MQTYAFQLDSKSLVPGLLADRPPICLTHNFVVNLENGEDVSCQWKKEEAGVTLGLWGSPWEETVPSPLTVQAVLP